MSEVFREQHPLLCEEAASEDEGKHEPAYRRLPYAVLRGRAATRAKGAAAIIKTWPDHWMSLLLYLWIVLAMISITIFIIYNSLTFVLLKPTASKMISQLRPMITSKLHIFDKSSLSSDIIMPVIVNNYQEVDFNKKFLPYIEIISQQYKEYKYNLIIILNDTNADKTVYDGDMNKISCELFDNNNNKQHTSNINIEKTTLSRFMSNSPLKNIWKHLPEHYVDFLIRAISIWDKGGISYNPLILTPHSPNPLYIKKLHRYLETHQKSKKNYSHVKESKKMHPKNARRLNNIRDIIDALENESDSAMQNNLIEEENKLSAVKTNLMDTITNSTSKAKVKKQDYEIVAKQNLVAERQMHYDVSLNRSNSDVPPPSLLPTFLEFLFREKPQKSDMKDEQSKVVVIENGAKSSVSKNHKNGAYNVLSSLENREEHHVRNEAAEVVESDGGLVSDDLDEFVLSIDLNGNFIATKTACHAFLGGLFTDVIHYTDTDTVTDLIIKELTLFCKGVLSSCKAIDIIII